MLLLGGGGFGGNGAHLCCTEKSDAEEPFHLRGAARPPNMFPNTRPRPLRATPLQGIPNSPQQGGADGGLVQRRRRGDRSPPGILRSKVCTSKLLLRYLFPKKQKTRCGRDAHYEEVHYIQSSSRPLQEAPSALSSVRMSGVGGNRRAALVGPIITNGTPELLRTRLIGC